MPIRFRCPHCNQLLGIARRKGGTLVRCPTCRTEVPVPLTSVVPTDAMAVPAMQAIHPPYPHPVHALGAVGAVGLGAVGAVGAVGVPVFEREDFSALLRPFPEPASAHTPPSRPVGESLPPNVPANTFPYAPAENDLVISTTTATILTVVLILLLALAFGAGLLVGRFYLAG